MGRGGLGPVGVHRRHRYQVRRALLRRHREIHARRAAAWFPRPWAPAWTAARAGASCSALRGLLRPESSAAGRSPASFRFERTDRSGAPSSTASPPRRRLSRRRARASSRSGTLERVIDTNGNLTPVRLRAGPAPGFGNEPGRADRRGLQTRPISPPSTTRGKRRARQRRPAERARWGGRRLFGGPPPRAGRRQARGGRPDVITSARTGFKMVHAPPPAQHRGLGGLRAQGPDGHRARVPARVRVGGLRQVASRLGGRLRQGRRRRGPALPSPPPLLAQQRRRGVRRSGALDVRYARCAAGLRLEREHGLGARLCGHRLRAHPQQRLGRLQRRHQPPGPVHAGAPPGPQRRRAARPRLRGRVGQDDGPLQPVPPGVRRRAPRHLQRGAGDRPPCRREHSLPFPSPIPSLGAESGDSVNFGVQGVFGVFSASAGESSNNWSTSSALLMDADGDGLPDLAAGGGHLDCPRSCGGAGCCPAGQFCSAPEEEAGGGRARASATCPRRATWRRTRDAGRAGQRAVPATCSPNDTLVEWTAPYAGVVSVSGSLLWTRTPPTGTAQDGVRLRVYLARDDGTMDAGGPCYALSSPAARRHGGGASALPSVASASAQSPLLRIPVPRWRTSPSAARAAPPAEPVSARGGGARAGHRPYTSCSGACGALSRDSTAPGGNPAGSPAPRPSTKRRTSGWPAGPSRRWSRPPSPARSTSGAG